MGIYLLNIPVCLFFLRIFSGIAVEFICQGIVIFKAAVRYCCFIITVHL